MEGFPAPKLLLLGEDFEPPHLFSKSTNPIFTARLAAFSQDKLNMITSSLLVRVNVFESELFSNTRFTDAAQSF